MKKIRIVVMVVSLLAGCQPLQAAIAPAGLQCEYRLNPMGIDVAQPRLFWQVQSRERDEVQTAYQILVASSKEQLEKNHGDLWDTGKIAGDDTVNIAYAGKLLVSGMPCFWKVKVWDKNGEASDWSAPARWSMGLLEQSDWQGKWIGWDNGEKTNDFGGATWIWFPEGNPAERAPVCTRYFRRVFELPEDEATGSANIEITADDQFDFFINGRQAGKGDGWGAPKTIAVGAFLKPGKNVLAVEARNVGNDPNPAGLIAKLKIEFKQGTFFTLNTDGNWESATNSEAGWNTSFTLMTLRGRRPSRSENTERCPGESLAATTGGCPPVT